MQSEELDLVLDDLPVDEMVDIASRLIEIPTIRGTSETGVADWLAAYLADAGYEVELQEVLPGRHQTVARLRGTGGGRSVMFNGHIDIDPLRADWVRDPWRPVVEGDLLYGAGARNMKGGVAAMVMAAEVIRRAKVKLSGDIVLACVMGELEGGTGTKHLLDSGVRTDMALFPEPLGAHNIVTAMPGVLELALTTFGFSEHVSRQYLRHGDERSVPVDAIKHMVRAIEHVSELDLPFQVSEMFPDLPFIHVGMLRAGRGENLDLRSTCYISDRCVSVLHVCYPPHHTAEQVEASIRARLEELSATDSTFRWELSSRLPEQFGFSLVDVAPTIVPVEEEVVGLVHAAYVDLAGREPDNVGVALPQCYTAGDHAHLWDAGIPCLYYGPSSPVRLAGDSDDCVSVSEMALTSKVFTKVALQVCR